MTKMFFKVFFTIALIGFQSLLIAQNNQQSGGTQNNSNVASYNSNEIAFSFADRDRLIQIEEKLNSQQKQIDDIKLQISDVKNLFFWVFGILITLMFFILGFIIWDRRTAMEPVRERTQSLIQSLREFAKDQPKLADILRSHGLM